MTSMSPNSGFDAWNYAPEAGYTGTNDLTGFHVEAIDGGIGHIDEATHSVDGSYLVVDTGPWIFGTKVLLPAGVIQRVDTAGETVYVLRTREQIKNAPPYDPAGRDSTSYRDDLGGYYGGMPPM
ncbi:PRC-barrel domain containing protein [Longispora sp. K20-0274]|uniref:PRC-barrel domain containing protein n=1 Tax=Longispora sp. K20-0274 TaxID=3088255 RepID=UPI0039997A96